MKCALILTGVVIGAFCLIAQTPTEEPKVVMTYCAMPKEPAEIAEFKPVGKYSASIAVRNTGNRGSIADYVIGYFTSRDKRERKLGARVRLRKPLRAGQVGPPTVEGVTKWKGKTPDKLVFFVAEVSFVDDSGYLSAPRQGFANFICTEHKP